MLPRSHAHDRGKKLKKTISTFILAKLEFVYKRGLWKVRLKCYSYFTYYML